MKKTSPTEAVAREVRGQWVAVAASECGLLCATYERPSRADALADVGGEGLPEGDLSLRAAEACARYLDAGEPIPAMPLDLRRYAAFTAAVLWEVSRIPKGEVRTYGQVAALVGKPSAARAAGQVLARNPLAPIVPCHRVVGVKGLVGFQGGVEGLARKRAMLKWEGAALPFEE